MHINTLDNGNFIICYRHRANSSSPYSWAYRGELVVLSPDGDKIGDTHQFRNGFRLSNISTIILDNSDIVVTYDQMKSQYPDDECLPYEQFLLYDQDDIQNSGTLYDFIHYEDDEIPIDNMQTITLDNGNFVLSYSITDSSNGLYTLIFSIFDMDCSKLNTYEIGSVYMNGDGLPHIISLGNKFVIVYKSYDECYSGKFEVFDRSGDKIGKTYTFFEGDGFRSPYIEKIDNNHFVISYWTGTDETGNFVVYSTQ
jgi:hypothetical protein